MFDRVIGDAVGPSLAGGAPVLLDAVSVDQWTAALAAAADVGDGSDPARIDVLRALEELKCAAEGLQALVTASFAVSMRAHAKDRGVPAERRDRGVAEQVGLARRESPHRGRRHLGLARALTRDLPHTFAALRAGRITEYRAGLVARETACLTAPDRQAVDARIAGDPAVLEAMGDQELVAAAQKAAYAIDPEVFVARRAYAESQRHVSVRPAPDAMTFVGALLPMRDGVACFAALTRATDTLVAAGDGRSRSQIMADTLVERVTGRTVADPAPIAVNLVITDQALLDPMGPDQGAWVDGYGPVPADLARDLVTHTQQASPEAVRLRRLWDDPDTGELTQMEARSRLFPATLAALIRFRDQRCRTPWCDSPIRHTDHATEAAAGGATSFINAQGLCEACNHTKQAPGWRASPVTGRRRHTIITTTPTGHHYDSHAPPGPRAIGEFYTTDLHLTLAV